MSKTLGLILMILKRYNKENELDEVLSELKMKGLIANNVKVSNNNSEISYDLKDMVNKIKEVKLNDRKKEISLLKNLLEQVILTKHYRLSSQSWSPMFERELKKRLNIGQKINEISGDGQYNDSKETVEIKVSLGCEKHCLNFVQIRPHHNCDKYLLMGYNIYEGELGRVYIFEIPHQKIVDMILSYGDYAHGTIKKQGEITLENMEKNMYEYSLRVNLLNEKGKKIWNELLNYETTSNYENIN